MSLRYSRNVALMQAMYRGPILKYGDFKTLTDNQFVFVEMSDVAASEERLLFLGLCHVRRVEATPHYYAAYDGERFIGDLDPAEDPESALWKDGDKVQWVHEGLLTRVYRALARGDN